ncbi:hypothetical protein SELMODRAFT_417461 [Selaginella moellendorffii]|uniref:Uncharacterized protein n=1 Tax=Selaginella moellendorffii TaxID=88036 RepID=D8S2A6_SELML|nr:hypothetical protein SELMODRAFT_417461 [Selaginella moellendorffii]
MLPLNKRWKKMMGMMKRRAMMIRKGSKVFMSRRKQGRNVGKTRGVMRQLPLLTSNGKITLERSGKTRNPDYFSLSHKDAKRLMLVKLNLKVFLVEYFNIMDEFLTKQASTSPTFLADSDAPEEEAHEEDPMDGVDPLGNATQVPGSSGKQKNPKKAEKIINTLFSERNALAAARN